MVRLVVWTGLPAVIDAGAPDALADRAELADDDAFLPKLKAALNKKRRHKDAPADGEPETPSTGGPMPFLVVGTALVLGVVAAKWIDWRGRARADR